MASDAMFKLEHTSDDVKKSTGVQMSVGQLEIRRSEYLDDYGLNKLARSKFRVKYLIPKTVNFPLTLLSLRKVLM